MLSAPTKLVAAVLLGTLLPHTTEAFQSGFSLGLRPSAGSNIRQCSSSARRTMLGAVSMGGKLENDLMVRVARGEEVERTPIWLFRQAGRHLPEYEAYKKETGCNFLQLLENPKHVAECTMQPVRRYNLDAAILFSDILVVAEALGIDVEMPGGKGILVPRPLTGPEDFKARIPKSINVDEKLSHVIESVSLIKKELNGKVPLIGFSAAPWTLMYYMVGGSSKKNQYTSAQIKAGADMLQIFEAMGEFISKESFYEFAMPCMQKIQKELRARHPDVPLLVFPRGATYSLVDLQQAGYDVVTMDTQTAREATRSALAEAAASNTPPNMRKGAAGLQGNFDVALLKAGEGSKEEVAAAAAKMLEQLGAQHLIANLGEGLTGKEDPELVDCLVESIHSISDKMIKAA